MACRSESPVEDLSSPAVVHPSFLEGGLDETIFLTPPPESLHCPICMLVLREPNLLSCCGKHICQVCVGHIEAARQVCPCCRTPGFKAMLNKEKRASILELKVYCSNKENGCGWTGELGDEHRHLENKCEYVQEVCRYGCGLKFIRPILNSHERDQCPNRPIEVKLESFMRITNEKFATQQREIDRLKDQLKEREENEKRLLEQIKHLREKEQVSAYEIIEENVYFDEGLWHLLNSPTSKDKDCPVATIEQCGVVVKSSTNPLVTIKGERRLVEDAKRRLRELQSKVVTSVVSFSGHSAAAQYLTKSTKLHFVTKCIDEEFRVHIASTKNEGVSDDATVDLTPSAMQRAYFVETAHSQTVSVYVGDITVFDKAEVIANPTDKHLGNTNPISQAIAERVGPVVTEGSREHIKDIGWSEGSILIANVGDLPSSYKAIVHALCPVMPSARLLRRIVKSIFQTAHKYSSIALPSFSPSTQLSPGTCALLLTEEIFRYFNSNPNALKHINIVVSREEVDKYVSAFQRYFGTSNSTVSGTSASGRETLVFTLSSGIIFQLAHNDITTSHVDAIVTPTNPRLQLTSEGGVSYALSSRGGPGLQEACDVLVLQGIRGMEGKVVETRCEGMGQLRCKSIFHVVFDAGAPVDQRKLFKTIIACLERAEKMKYTSIAFPPLWRGNDRFPPIKAVESIEVALKTFSKKRPRYVKVVCFVILYESVFKQFIAAIEKFNMDHESVLEDGLKLTAAVDDKPDSSNGGRSSAEAEVQVEIHGYSKESVKQAKDVFCTIINTLS